MNRLDAQDMETDDPPFNIMPVSDVSNMASVDDALSVISAHDTESAETQAV